MRARAEGTHRDGAGDLCRVWHASHRAKGEHVPGDDNRRSERRARREERWRGRRRRRRERGGWRWRGRGRWRDERRVTRRRKGRRRRLLWRIDGRRRRRRRRDWWRGRRRRRRRRRRSESTHPPHVRGVVGLQRKGARQQVGAKREVACTAHGEVVEEEELRLGARARRREQRATRLWVIEDRLGHDPSVGCWQREVGVQPGDPRLDGESKILNRTRKIEGGGA